MMSNRLITVTLYPQGDPRRRLFALWYFSVLIGLGTLLGHLVLGFEQSWAQPAVSLLAACAAQLGLEWIDARTIGRPPRYRGGPAGLAAFLLPAWIVGNAVAFLVYPGERLWPMVFASVLSVASKVLFRAPVAGGSQHIFNPSNIGITVTLLLFPSVGLAPPYHFTENVTGVWDWFVPGVILATGVAVHALFTGRLPLVVAWLVGFVVQAIGRGLIAGAISIAPFVPMTSAAFLLFTLYMIPDPATTPIQRGRQIAFGLAVALVYGALQLLHVVYGLFFALALVSVSRAVGLYWMARSGAGESVARRKEAAA
jgi:hypothetical protein